MDDTIVRLLKQANTQLENQGNELGGGQSPTPGPSSLSALEKPLKGLGGVLGGIMNIPKDLIEASARDVYNLGDHTQPKESVGPAFEAASLLAGVGLPMAERGAAGIFGGELAKTADLQALKEAKHMYSFGAPQRDILADTGWFRSPTDLRWKFEIPDHQMRLKFMPTGEGDLATSSVGSLVHHPELFKAYPDLQSLGMHLTKDSRRPQGQGMFHGSQGTLEVEAPNMGTAKSVTAHELQHGVQGLEGFQFGGDPSEIARLIEAGIRRKPELLGGNKLMDVVEQSFPMYRNLAGEVEARNVQNRLDWNGPSRRTQGPWETQDTPYSQQFLKDNQTGMIRALRGQ